MTAEAPIQIQSDMPLSNPKAPILTNQLQEMYLCISDGFAIHCLDIKQESISNDVVEPLPIISTLNLPEKGLPVLSGLFKLGSNAYLIGGREFPALNEKDEPHKWFRAIFHSMANLPGLKGTSRFAYSLSLVDGCLSAVKCDHIRPLKCPIAWPVVEKIGSQLHVYESFPADSFAFCIARDPQHLILNVNINVCGRWVPVKSVRYMSHIYYSRQYGARIWAHLTVGQRIYAKVNNPYAYTFVFDSETQMWDEFNLGVSECDGPFSIDHVVQIFDHGRGGCVGGFLSGEFGGLFHVFFAVVKYRGGMHAVVYLVASNTGQILRVQRLNGFFDRGVGPASVNENIVVEADVEGKTMCSVIDGGLSSSVHGVERRCLFVHTFTVE